METSVKKLANSRVEIFFKIPREEFEKFRGKAILKFGQELKIEGFRLGKAPKEVIEKEIGEVRILEEAVRELLEENYPKLVSENKIDPLTQPEVEVLPPANSINGGVEFKASLFVFPEIKLPDYKKIASQIKRNKVLVEEAEIEEGLRRIQKSRAKFTLKNQPAEKGDFIEIDFSSPQIEAGFQRKDGFILGEGHFIPGFEENLIGMTNGESKNFSLKFPKNHFKKDMAGKTFDFKVRVNSVQKMELPEINDEWVKGLGDFNDLASIKNSLREGINTEKEMAESQRIRQEILEKLSDNSKMEIPEILIEREKNVILDELKEKIAEVLKMPFEEYLTKIKKTEKELKDSFFEEAQKRAKYDLILREVAIREEIGASEEEIKEKLNKMVKNYSIDKVKELDLEKLKLYIESEIRKEKTLAKLESFARND
jgi:trigger factor